jgi:type IV pilus biogenesis protein CpaD/CtpE
MTRIASFSLALAAAVVLSACVFAPPSGSSNAFDADAMAKNSERALATCGVGNVKEVNSKSFSCK